MNPKAEASDSRFDMLKWLLVVVLVVVGVVGNQYYSAEPILYRVLALLVIAAAAAFVALQTGKGKAFVLAKEARAEIRKVVWPTRQETTQTTLIVVAVVLVMALLLWGLIPCSAGLFP